MKILGTLVKELFGMFAVTNSRFLKCLSTICLKKKTPQVKKSDKKHLFGKNTTQNLKNVKWTLLPKHFEAKSYSHLGKNVTKNIKSLVI